MSKYAVSKFEMLREREDEEVDEEPKIRSS